MDLIKMEERKKVRAAAFSRMWRAMSRAIEKAKFVVLRLHSCGWDWKQLETTECSEGHLGGVGWSWRRTQTWPSWRAMTYALSAGAGKNMSVGTPCRTLSMCTLRRVKTGRCGQLRWFGLPGFNYTGQNTADNDLLLRLRMLMLVKLVKRGTAEQRLIVETACGPIGLPAGRWGGPD